MVALPNFMHFDAVRQALGHLKGKYVGACWGDKSADGFADSIDQVTVGARSPEGCAGQDSRSLSR